MSTENLRLQFLRGSNYQNNNYTGAEGELTVDTTHRGLRLHDGVTPGGEEVLSKKGLERHMIFDQSINIYVNSQTGSDSNDGSNVANAMQTLDGVFDKYFTIGYGGLSVATAPVHRNFIIRLADGQTFEIYNQNRLQNDGFLHIYGNRDNRPRIVSKMSPNPDSDGRYFVGSIRPDNTVTVFMSGVELETADLSQALDAERNAISDFYRSMLSPFGSTKVCNIFFRSCSIYLRHGYLYHHHGNGSIGVSNVYGQSTHIHMGDFATSGSNPAWYDGPKLVGRYGTSENPFDFYLADPQSINHTGVDYQDLFVHARKDLIRSNLLPEIVKHGTNNIGTWKRYATGEQEVRKIWDIDLTANPDAVGYDGVDFIWDPATLTLTFPGGASPAEFTSSTHDNIVVTSCHTSQVAGTITAERAPAVQNGFSSIVVLKFDADPGGWVRYSAVGYGRWD